MQQNTNTLKNQGEELGLDDKHKSKFFMKERHRIREAQMKKAAHDAKKRSEKLKN